MNDLHPSLVIHPSMTAEQIRAWCERHDLVVEIVARPEPDGSVRLRVYPRHKTSFSIPLQAG